MNISLLKKLSESCGVSGFENEVRELIKSEIKSNVDKIEIDNLGNLIAFKKGIKNKKTALIAHMDEIGFVVKRVEKGFINFTKIGGIDDRILLSQRVIIKGNKDIEGVIGCKPVHLQKDEEKKQVVKSDQLYIDVADEKTNIEKGMPVCFASEFKKIGKTTYTGKAMDNRLGVFCLIELIKKIKKPKNDLYFIFSTQEEVGLKGARTAVFSIEPDLAIIIDTTYAGDVPVVSEKECDTKLGKGVVINLIESCGAGAIIPEKIKELVINTAKKKKIKYQIEIGEGGMTDAAIVQITKKGILSCSLSIPVRNLHTPCEIFDIRDVKETVKLVENLI
ncbi:MAG: peptidase M42 [Candidatus Aenigmarchaeota archaeon ex4484_56]|nr:MAG: peptidase M42 [Candidatus Aenigmarchaeota archaeon ex4484_56]